MFEWGRGGVGGWFADFNNFIYLWVRPPYFSVVQILSNFLRNSEQVRVRWLCYSPILISEIHCFFCQFAQYLPLLLTPYMPYNFSFSGESLYRWGKNSHWRIHMLQNEENTVEWHGLSCSIYYERQVCTYFLHCFRYVEVLTVHNLL